MFFLQGRSNAGHYFSNSIISSLFEFNMLMFPAYGFILLLKNENCKFPHILMLVVEGFLQEEVQTGIAKTTR